MTIKIFRHKHVDDKTYKLYDVTFFETTISTIVTTHSSAVDSWILETEKQHKDCLGLQPVVVGLDVEWRPNVTRNSENPIAVIQLCAGERCLVFQILHSPIVPYSLLNFLANPCYVFTGVGIKDDVDKLMKQYYHMVARTADLRPLALAVYGRKVKDFGLTKLAVKVLKKHINKPKRVTMSDWDNWWLSPPQVQYACVDAYLSSEIGRVLISKSKSAL